MTLPHRLRVALAVLVLVATILPVSPLRAARTTDRVVVFLRDAFDPFAEPMQADRSDRSRILALMDENHRRSLAALDEVLGALPAAADARSLRVANAVALRADGDLVATLRRSPAVKRVIADAPVRPPRLALSSTEGTPAGGYAEGLPQIGAVQVWERLGVTGAGVLVGHIDTGADASHPDLAGRLAGYRDFVEPGNAVPRDTDGHGTHTAGTIAGGATSGTAIGVAPGARLLVARAIGSGASISTLLQAMDWMCDPDGNPATDDAPRLASCSWHSGSGDQSAFYEALASWVALGIFPCFSAGNSGPGASTITHPKEYPGCFASAAVDFTDKVTSFSSRGPAKYLGATVDKPDAAAPGNDVWSARTGGGYTRKSGTSMACPHTAGVVALMLEAAPALTVEDIGRTLKETSKDLGAPGFDTTYGQGRVDALAAVEAVASGARVRGRLLALGGAPLGGTVTVVERNLTVPTKPSDGSFALFLPAGTWTLRASAFAFLESSQTVTVAADETQDVTLTLAPAPTVALGGTVVAAESGAPLGARVRILDTPLPVVDTEPATGRWSLPVPAGTYRIRVLAFGRRPLILGPVAVAAATTADAQLQPLPPVLLVDDDGGKDYERHVKAALVGLGIDHDVLVRDDGPLTPESILGYDTVLWMTGLASSGTLTLEDRAALTQYLDAGGSLLLTGQDVGYELKSEAFYRDVLGARYVKDKADGRRARGAGLDVAIAGPGGADNQKYPDVIEPAAGTGAVRSYDYGSTAEGAGVRRVHGAGKVAYLGFSLEGIPVVADRAAVLGAELSWLGLSDEALVRRVVLLPRELRETYLTDVLEPRLGAERLAAVAKATGLTPVLRALRVLGGRPAPGR